MISSPEHSRIATVAIVGAGVAGLSVGNFLQRNGVDCVILEKHSRHHVESRQRAGTVDSFGARMFHRWGLDDALRDPAPVDEPHSGFFIDGIRLSAPEGINEVDDNADAVFIPQQVLVANLANLFLEGGGTIHYEAGDLRLHDVEGGSPTLTYRQGEVTHTLHAEIIAGSDGDRGVSRTAIPAEVLTRYEHEFDYSWLSVLAAAETSPSGMAIHPRGLAGMIPRGRDATRIYLQVPRDDDVTSWTDERIWAEVQERFGTLPTTGPILSRTIVALRSVVHEPMSYGSLYLLGDAAHIVPPMSAKGIHLALHDAELFARAVIDRRDTGTDTALWTYSDAALAHVWNYQAFAAWITAMMHDAGDTSYAGTFRQRTARAELTRQFASPTANALFSELTAGLN